MRRRILMLVVGMTTLVVLAFAIPVGVLLRSAVEQRVEHATTDQAQSVALSLRSGTTSRSALTSLADSQTKSTGRATSVMLPDGTVVGTPPPGSAAGAGPFPTGPGSGQTGQTGQAGQTGQGGPGGPSGLPQAELHTVPGGRLAIAPVHLDGASGGNYLVRVYVSSAALHAGEGKWWLLLGGGSLGLVLLGAAAAEFSTRRIVRPLVRTAATAHQLSTGDTTARAPLDGPREIGEVGAALNRLADRIDELIAEERETVADLSHRLRTPLTAMRLDAEALRDPEESERMGEHVGVLERTLTAVIRAARRPQREGRLPSCDAAAVVAERVQFWSALAEDQGRAVVVTIPDAEVAVRSSADDLAAALDALLENVIAHTPEGTPFRVTLEPIDSGARLVVEDEGPGISVDALARGRSDRGSSGLGLDIARRCAQAAGGSMNVAGGPSGGAVVTLEFAGL